ncbi:hypothetical protein HDV00_006718 [Rhizophlyctis rosea]|nr:hypothetical protein HDV00_006718 [Rhizophlyctis rosea]
MDGFLRIVDYVNERLVDTYKSFFGGLTSVCWSPDGKFILTGGQDDLITVWSFRGRCIVARCQGHASWVTAVEFDPYRCTDRSYRFGSVGEDTRLCLWEFSVGSLHRPKVSAAALKRSRAAEAELGYHPVLSKSEVAVLEPFRSELIHSHPLCTISFREDSIVTTDKEGLLKVWDRP